MTAKGRLENLLADWAEEATILKLNGMSTATHDRFGAAVRDCMVAYLDWMTEQEAQLWSGWSANRLRSHFPEWMEQGLAEWVGEGRRAKRRYRRQVVPRRADTAGAFEAGKRSA